MPRAPVTRKRRAPGASSVPQLNDILPAYDFSQLPPNTDFNSTFDFNPDSFAQSDQSYNDPTNGDGNHFNVDLNASQPATYGGSYNPAATSTDLVRRPRNQTLARNVQQEQWSGYGGGTPGQMDDEDEQELERRVAMAKRDAQGKRKQIPPFVQKLSR